MFLNRSRIVVCLMLLTGASATVFTQNSGPKGTVTAFYKFDRSHSQVFNRRNIVARKQWFSTELYELLMNELAKEKAYLAKNPTDKPHFGDGLPFQPLDETCELNGKSYRRAISYGKVTVKGDLANVDVHFKYPNGCNLPDILYAVNMSKERGRWVIDDIRYIADSTSLVEDLTRKEY
ncbi:MAG: hypothetical protein AB7V18_15890 [Pyrinomonadaceae bacterium]